MAENIRNSLAENFFEYYSLNMFVNINTIIALNISVNTTLKHYYSEDLNEKLKLMGWTLNFFSKKLLSNKIFSSMVRWATKCYLKKLENPAAPSPTYLMFGPLKLTLFLWNFLKSFPWKYWLIKGKKTRNWNFRYKSY